MMKRLGGVVLGGVLLAGLAVTPASARQDETITVVCEPSGFTVVADAHSFPGQSTANEHFNLVNPFGDTCGIVP